jgi:bifunctional NMN adenylyltransferase/nudix hydrolase
MTTLGVFIGRMQPATKAHIEIIRKMLNENTHALVIIGSANCAPSTRNPFSFEERAAIAGANFTAAELAHISFRGLEDSNYDFNSWLKNVQRLISETIIRIGRPEEVGIFLYGHYKDQSSYYLNYFPDMDFVEIPTLEGNLSATSAREKYFSEFEVMNANEVGMTEKSFSAMKKICGFYSERYSELAKEFAFLKKYKKSWEAAPYPPIFVTVDNLVICQGRILLVRRGHNPGKGLYAMPGGFLNPEETLLNAAIRELKEETHIKVSREELLGSLDGVHVFDMPDRDPRGRTITHVHIFDLCKFPQARGNARELPEVKADDDADEAVWVSFAEFEKMRPQAFGDHYAIVEKLLLGRAA